MVHISNLFLSTVKGFPLFFFFLTVWEFYTCIKCALIKPIPILPPPNSALTYPLPTLSFMCYKKSLSNSVLPVCVCVWIHRFRTIYQSLTNFSGLAFLKKTGPPFPSSHEMPATQIGAGLNEPPPPHLCWDSDCLDAVQVWACTASVSSCMQRPCCVYSRALHLALIILIPSLPR